MYLGLLAILAIPSILNVLVHTKRSSSDFTAYKRYIQTIYHTLTWFRHDLVPGSRSWQSLEAVRKMHFHANRSAIAHNVGMVSQKDMVITQYGFMGFTLNNKKQVGFHASQEQINDYCHFWKVLGCLVGIRDEYNLCCDTLEETMERLEVVRQEFLFPAHLSPPRDFAQMARYVANGMWCFNPRDAYNVMIFTIKRLVGIPNYYYQENEIPDGYDREKLEIYKMGWYDRFLTWFTAFIHEYLLQFSIFRVFFNMQTSFHEFLITYFPFLAMYSFGFKNSYVKILDKKDE